VRAVLSGIFRRDGEVAPPGTRFVLFVLAGAVIVRVLSIAAYRYGGDDLTVYTYFSRLLLHGQNPFDAPPGVGPRNPVYADNPTGSLGLYAGILALWDSRTALRILFLVADLASVLTVAYLFRRPRWWRVQLMLLIAFNPFLLIRWTFSAEDKTLLFLWLALLIAFLEQDRHIASWTAATVLGILKWLSVYLVLPLAAFTASRRGYSRALLAVGLSFLTVAVITIPFFPDSLKPWSRREARLNVVPEHESPTRLLDAVGLWDPLVVKIFIPAAVLAVFALYLAGRIDIREAVILSFGAAIVLLPDIGRGEWVALPLILIMRLTPLRLLAIWGSSIISSIDTVAESRKGRNLPFHPFFERLLGSGEGTLLHVFLLNLFFFVVLLLYAVDRMRGRVDIDAAWTLRFSWPVMRPKSSGATTEHVPAKS
jgi:hypothetical protein